MRLKHRPTDFRVRELLAEGVLVPTGKQRVYRVTKTKLTSVEAAATLASEAGLDAGTVAMCGLKDRQGVSVQHMSVPRGHDIEVRTANLRIEPIGFASEPLASADSRGNAFEIVVRALDSEQLALLRASLPIVRRDGVPNYFDDQRFGNVRHEQGWIARDLALGKHAEALQRLLAGPSPFDGEKERLFKGALRRSWDDPAECLAIARRFGAHHSVFEHLVRKPGDTAGAFTYISSRLRLIHLFAFQSHLWNRAVAELFRHRLPLEERVVVECCEGPLVCPGASLPTGLSASTSFRLPGPELADVDDAEQRALLTAALATEGLTPARFRIDGVPGFQLKGEDRRLFVVPRYLRVRPPKGDSLHRGLAEISLRFELPRGAYATLIVKRLLARTAGERERSDPRPAGDRRDRGARGDRQDRRDRPPHRSAGRPGGHGRRRQQGR